MTPPAQPKATSQARYAPEIFRHVVPAPQIHELVLDTHANPTAPEEEPAYTSRQQAEGPPARALSLPPTHLNRHRGGQAKDREPNPSERRDHKLCTHVKAESPLTRDTSCPRWD